MFQRLAEVASEATKHHKTMSKDQKMWHNEKMPFARKDKAQEKWQEGSHANCVSWSAAPRYTMARGGKTKDTRPYVVEDKSKNSKFEKFK